MKKQMKLWLSALLLFGASYLVSAQENITIVTPNSQLAEGLDLNAVAELFKDSENLEEFEKTLNDPEIGINNLDLNRDGYVDYIRVVEHAANDSRVIILQVPLGQDEFQDIATIEVERTGNENYNMQVCGNEVIYGADYYIAPMYVHVHHIHGWRIMAWLFRPMYYPYHSVYYFGYYPGWWRPYRPVVVHVYHHRTERYTRRATFEHTRQSRVEVIHKTSYQQRTSPRFQEQARATQPAPTPERISRQDQAEPTTPIRAETRRSDNNFDKPTVKDDALRIDKPKRNYKKPVRRDAEAIKKPRAEQNKTFKNDTQKMSKPKSNTKPEVRNEAKKIARPKSDASPAVKKEVKKNNRSEAAKKPAVKNGRDDS